MKQTKAQKLGLMENRVHMGIFDYEVIIVIGDYSKMNEYVSYKYEEDVDTNVWDKGYAPRGRCFYKTGYVPIIWIPRKPRTAREHATFAHECLHAVWHVFDWASVPTNTDTEEVMCHAVAHLIANGLKETTSLQSN